MDREAELPAGVVGRVDRELDALNLVAAGPGLVEQQAMAAADVEEAAARRSPGDRVEDPVGRRPAAPLLLEVVLVAHVAVEVEQRVALREARLRDRPAARALVEIAVLAGLVVRGREGLRLGLETGARVEQGGRAAADLARVRRPHPGGDYPDRRAARDSRKAGAAEPGRGLLRARVRAAAGAGDLGH